MLSVNDIKGVLGQSHAPEFELLKGKPVETEPVQGQAGTVALFDHARILAPQCLLGGGGCE